MNAIYTGHIHISLGGRIWRLLKKYEYQIEQFLHTPKNNCHSSKIVFTFPDVDESQTVAHSSNLIQVSTHSK